MGLTTIAKYLIGQRQAILQVANTPHALWLGLLFVLSAGFAREYDGEDLLREPWHLLLPLGASLATATLLFGLLWLVFEGWKTFESTAKAYRSFLALYWMTAPLAWLYAIPFERWLSDGDATRANLWLLGIVAIWRVVLMIRVVSIVWRVSFMTACFPVLLFADTVALVLLTFIPIPIVSIMGGIRSTESENLIHGTAILISVVGMLSWPVWLGLTISSGIVARMNRAHSPLLLNPARYVAPSAWSLALVALLLGIAVLPVTQPAQQLRASVEHDLRQGEIHRALATMSQHPRDAFPPHWDPPPRIGYRETQPPLVDVLEALSEVKASPWISEVYSEKLARQLSDRMAAWHFWPQVDEATFDRYLTLFENQFVDTPHWEGIQRSLTNEISERRTPQQQARVRKLLGMEPLPEHEAE
jgi:hypothetical protein